MERNDGQDVIRDGADGGSRPETSLDPAAMLALIGDQQARTVDAISVEDGILYFWWGIGLTVGHTALFLSAPGGPATVLPSWGGAVAMVAGLVTAVIATGLHIHRASAGLTGPSQRQSTQWGFAWFVAFVGIELLGMALARQQPGEVVLTLYFSVTPGLVTGVMYLAGGAMWGDDTMYALGVWLILVFGASAFAGVPWIFLVLAVGAGPVLFAVSLVQRKRHKRRRVAPAAP